jgi:hypothetical protein
MVKQLKPVSSRLVCFLKIGFSTYQVGFYYNKHRCFCQLVVGAVRMGTYLYKAIPDTKLTIGKYADPKFEYLSFCLKVKEKMDDEEFNYALVQEPLYHRQ